MEWSEAQYLAHKAAVACVTCSNPNSLPNAICTRNAVPVHIKQGCEREYLRGQQKSFRKLLARAQIQFRWVPICNRQVHRLKPNGIGTPQRLRPNAWVMFEKR